MAVPPNDGKASTPMRKVSIPIAALVAAALVLTGCGSDAGTGNTSAAANAPTDTAAVSAAVSDTAAPASDSAGAGSGMSSGSDVSSGSEMSSGSDMSSGSGMSSAESSGGGGGAVSGKVGVILPDTTSSSRYTLYDAPLLTAAFKDAGVEADVQNAGGSTAKYTTIAQSMIGAGVKVLIMDSIDPTSGAAVEAMAKKAGIQVIDYDRVNLGGSADYYVSFDNEQVGKLQGETLVQCLSDAKVSDAQIIEMDGGTDVDNNAVLFKSGAESVLKPLQEQGKLKVVSDSVVKGWNINEAAPTFTQALTANGNKVDGVLAANDDIANAVIGVLRAKGLAGKVQVTGQDAGVGGLQNILQGTQCMTIFKNVKLEAEAASKLAIALIKGEDPGSAGLKIASFDDPKGKRTLKAVLLAPQVITIKNVQDVVKAGALTAAQICKGIQDKCTAAGVK